MKHNNWQKLYEALQIGKIDISKETCKILMHIEELDAKVEQIYNELTFWMKDDEDTAEMNEIFENIFNPYGDFIEAMRREAGHYMARRLRQDKFEKL